MRLGHPSINCRIFVSSKVSSKKKLVFPFEKYRYIYKTRWRKKLKSFYVTLTLSLVHTNMIIYFCLHYYPKELFSYVKPEIQNFNRHKWHLSQENQKQSKCLCWWPIIMNEVFFVIKDKIVTSFMKKFCVFSYFIFVFYLFNITGTQWWQCQFGSQISVA